MAIRTPLTKGKKGGMKDTQLDFMVYALLKQVRERMNMDPGLVEDICLGNVRYTCSIQSLAFER
jgi:acetyl-CoA acyltransferase 1